MAEKDIFTRFSKEKGLAYGYQNMAKNVNLNPSILIAPLIYAEAIKNFQKVCRQKKIKNRFVATFFYVNTLKIFSNAVTGTFK